MARCAYSGCGSHQSLTTIQDYLGAPAPRSRDPRLYLCRQHTPILAALYQTYKKVERGHYRDLSITELRAALAVREFFRQQLSSDVVVNAHGHLTYEASMRQMLSRRINANTHTHTHTVRPQ